MIKLASVQICSLVYLFLLLIVFLYKKKTHNLEGTIYQVLLLITVLVVVFDILNIYYILNGTSEIIKNITAKCYLSLSILWCLWLMVYVFNINSENSYKTLKDLFKNNLLFKIGCILTLFLCSGTFFLKSDFIINKDSIVSYQGGEALFYTCIICFIYMGIMTIYAIYNPKKISFIKRIPIFTFLFLGLLSIVIQWINPSILLVSSVMSFSMLFIYFTMENPDLKIINELEKDNEKVIEESKAKTDFLSNMSHDIRTPMNAIIGFSESLLMENLNEKQKGEVQNIYEAATTLLGIINNVLDVSRIESGKEEKQEKNYELRKIIMQLTSVVTSKIDPNKIKFNIQMEKNVPSFFIGDELKIYQILMNLLSNAVKYTNEGKIDFLISSEIFGDIAKIKFVVSDTGIGIKESDFDKLFVKFSRIHNQENYKEIEGTGLGLVITKKLVELLGGTIEFTSEYGKGTTFTVIIPQTISNEVEVNDAIKAITTKSTVNNVHFDGSLYDVLVVDDNNLNLKVAERILSDYKFQITLASSGEECINLLKDGKRFDLIFLDHMMPIKDGIQTMKEIKSIQGIKIPPVIALTANAMVGMKEMYLSEGFDGYISKPINREELQTLLNNFFCKK